MQRDHCPCGRAQYDGALEIRCLADLHASRPAGLRYLDPASVAATLKSLNHSRTLVTTVQGDSLSCARPHRIRWGTAALDSHPATECLALQLADTAPATVAYTPTSGLHDDLDVLHFFGHTGALQFRVALNDLALGLALDALPDSVPASPDGPLSAHDNNVHSLTATLALKRRWHTGGAAWHLAQFQQATSADRLRALPLLGVERARPVSPLVIPSWLEHMREMGMAYWRLMVGDMSTQADGSVVTGLAVQSSHVLLQSRLGLSVLDLNNIGSCWETRFTDGDRDVTFIELYSAQGTCLAVMAPYREHGLHYWRSVTNSLPGRVSRTA
ncbi:MAG: hypothetical protein AAGA11_15850 [Pseudomonadota bacterium]